MPFRKALQSPSARILCLILLVLFLVICGFHIAGARHNGDSSDLGLVDGLALIGMLVGFIALSATAASIDHLGFDPPVSSALSLRPCPLVSRSLAAEAPLLL